MYTPYLINKPYETMPVVSPITGEAATTAPSDRLNRVFKPGVVVIYGEGSLGVVTAVRDRRNSWENISRTWLRVAKPKADLQPDGRWAAKPTVVWVMASRATVLTDVTPKDLGLQVNPTVEVSYAQS